MPFVERFERHVAARLRDFFGANTPWHRRLWGSGIALTLKEILEASHAVRAGVLSGDTLSDLTNYAIVLAGKDPGVGSAERKRVLQRALRGNVTADGVEFSVVQAAIDDLEASYLSRWETAVADAGARPQPERTARAIACHLLDAGFSPTHLHKWCTFHVKSEQGARSLSDLVSAAEELSRRPPKTYKILVGFHNVPRSRRGLPENCLSADAASRWLRNNRVDVSGARQNGAMLFQVVARDELAALQLAVDHVEHLISRVTLGTDSELRPTQQAWVEGVDTTFPFRPEHRHVEVHALHREDQLYSAQTNSIVDAAMELMGSLNSSPASSAVGAGWAAIEALLSGPGDQDVAAADRMADLVACSFVRAELTYLSYRLQAQGGELAGPLAACESNRDRAAVVYDGIERMNDSHFAEDSDGAALRRMQSIRADPFARLGDVQVHAAASFKRLYRNRNLVLHGGKTDAVGLSACLRTAGPLVGAGMDRIAHAWFVQRMRPMELAARARVSLGTASSSDGSSLVDLL